MATTSTLRITFSTANAGEQFQLSLSYAKPALKETGGLATVQTAAAAIIAQQPFDSVTLGAFVSADFIERTVTGLAA